jgi:hypothetical protein
MNDQDIKKEFINKYMTVGDKKFYNFLLAFALEKILQVKKKSYKGVHPHLEYLEYYEKFLVSYRKEGDEVYLQIAKNFRRAAHKIYRSMLKQNMIDKDNKFLNLV